MNRALIERTIAAMDKGYMGHHHAEYAAVMAALKAELEAVRVVRAESDYQLACEAVGMDDYGVTADHVPLYTKGTP